MKSFYLLMVLGFFWLSRFQAEAASTLVVTYQGAGVQTSAVGSSFVYNFNSLGTGVTTSVSWTGWGGSGTFDRVNISDASQFGGAGGNGRYLFANGSNVSTLTLNSPVSYFGMWWSAGDSGNVLDFYNGSNLIISFSSSILSGLPTGFNGNPNSAFSGQNSGEKYAFLNFFIQNGDRIDRIVARGSNFESDNWTLRDPAYGLVAGDASTLPGTPVAQYNVTSGGTTTITDPSQMNTASVPEPSSGGLFIAGMAVLAALRRRKA